MTVAVAALRRAGLAGGSIGGECPVLWRVSKTLLDSFGHYLVPSICVFLDTHENVICLQWFYKV